MKNKLILNADQIRKQEIPKESYGYSMEFVNKFLDNVANDYDLVEEHFIELNNTIKLKEAKVEELEDAINQVTSAKHILEDELKTLKSGGGTDYATVLKRIAENEFKVNKLETKLIDKLDAITNLINKK